MCICISDCLYWLGLNGDEIMNGEYLINSQFMIFQHKMTMEYNKSVETQHPGKLIITNFKLQFIKEEDQFDIFKREYYTAPLFLISKIEKQIDNKK